MLGHLLYYTTLRDTTLWARCICQTWLGTNTTGSAPSEGENAGNEDPAHGECYFYADLKPVLPHPVRKCPILTDTVGPTIKEETLPRDSGYLPKLCLSVKLRPPKLI